MAESEKKKTKKKDDFSKLNLIESRSKLQEIHIQVQTEEEKDTSKIKKLKKHIARLFTELNKNK